MSNNTAVVIETGATVLGSTRGEDWPLLVAAEVWPQFGHGLCDNPHRHHPVCLRPSHCHHPSPCGSIRCCAVSRVAQAHCPPLVLSCCHNFDQGSDCVPGTAQCGMMHQSLLFGWRLHNVTITGGGTFDCNSKKDTWWSCASNISQPPCSGAGRPHCVMLSSVNDVEMSHLHVANSPDWTLHFSACTRVRVHHMNVTNPLEPNADGIDIDSTQDALIEDNFFSVGDDALCVKVKMKATSCKHTHLRSRLARSVWSCAVVC